MRVLPSLRQSFGFVIAWLFFTLTGITVCSQFNMAEISNMGIVISLSERLQTTAQDVMGMAPLFGAIFGLGLLIAMIVASLVARFLPDSHICRRRFDCHCGNIDNNESNFRDYGDCRDTRLGWLFVTVRSRWVGRLRL